MKLSMIAACGMNCGICLGHLREKNQCQGCNENDKGKPKACRQCSITRCPRLADSGSRFCFACEKFPCRRLLQLDKRYRTNYGMSMLENLEAIVRHGVRAFVAKEKARWTCSACGATICVHRPQCLACGADQPHYPAHRRR